MNEIQFTEHLRKHHIKLNPQQEQAVKTVNGPILLLAVPGSGKTTTLVARIGYMIFCCGIDPDRILTLTYTNAATRDMKRRFEEVFGVQGETNDSDRIMVRFQTINSLSNGIIDEYIRLTGGTKFKLVPDTAVIISQLYRKVYQDFPTEGEIGETARVIAYIKNMRLPSEEIKKLKIGEYDAEPLYNAYIRYMRQNRQMDFDDQLTISLRILVQYPEIRQWFRERYPYVLVDEAQDTSKVQHEIIRMLAGDAPNLFMVGDEDQSIYGFRAAYPQALLDFEEQYKGASVLFLEESYRSTPQIVSSAGKFIASNKKRKKKQMVTSRESGADLNYIQLDSRYGQYAYMIKCLQDVKSHTAVLMRNNDSAIPLIYYLRKNGIPYQSRGMETTFFSHRVLRDIKDFIAFARDPADADIFMRIYYKTGLRIKKEHALNTVRNYDPDLDRGLFHTYLRLYGQKQSREKIRKLIDELNGLKKDYAWEAIGRIQYKIRKVDDSEREKFFLLRILAEHGENVDHFMQKLDGLKQMIAECTYDSGAKVHVSTVHSAKGLEYSEVYIIDAVDGIMPAVDADDIEEERRIFYVAMTRAKDRLNIVCYKDQKMPFVNILQGKTNTTRKVISGDNKSASEFFRKGERVRHVTFGQGTVIALKEEKVVVQFDSGRRSKILAQYSVENRIMRSI